MRKLAATHPDLIYASTYYPEGGAIAKDIRRIHSGARCFMGLANQDPAFATTAGAAADIPARPSALPPSSSGDLREPTAEQTAVIADLHWLIHQGHVIEFANGRIEAARKPVPKPPRPEPKLAESSVSRPTSSNETTASIQLTATPAPPAQEEEGFPVSRPDEAAPALTAPEGAADRPESPAETAGASPAPLNPADSATAPDQGV